MTIGQAAEARMQGGEVVLHRGDDRRTATRTDIRAAGIRCRTRFAFAAHRYTVSNWRTPSASIAAASPRAMTSPRDITT